MDIKNEHDLHAAITIGLSAANYLILRIEQSECTFRNLQVHDTSGASERIAETCHAELLKTANAVNEMIQSLGDCLNGLDGCEDSDEKATDYAFEVMKLFFP